MGTSYQHRGFEQPDDESWVERAACREMDPNLFFPVGETGPAVEQAENAKEVCRGCEVAKFCLDYALTTRQDHGIWGGYDERERRVMIRRRSRAQAM